MKRKYEFLKTIPAVKYGLKSQGNKVKIKKLELKVKKANLDHAKLISDIGKMTLKERKTKKGIKLIDSLGILTSYCSVLREALEVATGKGDYLL